MLICDLCYELYKIDWERRISPERKMDSWKNCFEEEAYEVEDYENYLDEAGYDGELYVCHDEFLDAEYLDKEYIKGLLDNDKLYAKYLADIKEH